MWENLAPNVIRQRVIVECTTEKMIQPKQMKAYLSELAKVAKMEVLTGPVANIAYHGAWVHWKSSGAHTYSYKAKPLPLFTVDMYTCKPFDVKEVVEFTKNYFSAIEIVWKEIKV